MTRHRTTAFTAVSAAVLVAGAVTGCSDGDDGGSSSSPPPSASAPASSSPPASASPSGNARTRITIDNFTYTPGTLTVAPGTKITVTNNDTATHTLTAVTDRAWDTGDLAPGESATFTAPTRPGAYRYTCTIHPFMKGTLTVR